MWSCENFWQKAKLYIQKSESSAPEDFLFPFWRFLALEFLLRASLSKIHPALLAEKDSKNMLYAFGYDLTTTPKQIPITEVIERCKSIIEGFTEEEKKLCLTWMNMRNIELHTGITSLVSLQTTEWLSDYYRVTNLLVTFLNKTMEELFGTSVASAAQKMIDSQNESVREEVIEAIQHAKIFANKLSENEKLAKETEVLEQGKIRSTLHRTKKLNPCPACSKQGILEGEIIKTGDARLLGATLVSDITVLPTKFACDVCRLSLNGFSRLQVAGIGGQYTVTSVEDPVEYFGIEPESYEHHYEEYMDE